MHATGKILGGFVALMLGTSSLLAADLTIWWTKGNSQAEDDGLRKVIALWEEKTGKTVELSFYASGDTEAKVVTAMKAGSPPDLTFDFGYDLAYTPIWAYEGLLADVSDVIEPIADRFQPGALTSVKLLNGETGERAYYAIPWVQMTPHVHYWNDMLEDAGFASADIPNEWQPFFDFWCEQVQPALRAKGQRVYALGQGSSTSSNDPFFNMHLFLNAFDAQVVSADGTLQINQPETREKAIAALDSYTKPILAKCAPPDSVSWSGSGDNVSFVNRRHLVAMNPTLSVPLSVKDQPEVYMNDIKTTPWPNGVDGKPSAAMISVKQVLMFRDSAHIDNAKSFMSLLLEPENIGPMLQATGGRWMPVMPALIEDPFYSATDDPHISAMYRQFTQAESNIPYPQTYNRLYAKVMQEQLWQKAIGRVVIDGWSSAEAIDEIGARIEVLFK